MNNINFQKHLLCLVAVFALISGGCQGNDKLLVETKGADGSPIPPDILISVSLSETLG